VARLSEWAANAGWAVVRVEAEVGSAINGARRTVQRLLAEKRKVAGSIPALATTFYLHRHDDSTLWTFWCVRFLSVRLV
jgi:predicted site-specific integrase-resolvase